MKLCVGLGNPGPQYEATRHNVGFWVIDALALHFGVELTQVRFYGTWAQVHGPAGRLGLLKPQTYMNRSGQAVVACMQFFQLAPNDVIVLHDDIDLALGMAQLVQNRGSAGHRGVVSINEGLGTKDYWRLRIGVGRPPKGGDPSDYVLRPFETTERVVIDEKIRVVAQAILVMLAEGPEHAQGALR